MKPSPSLILDVDILSALTAGLVRSLYIDRLNQLPEGVGVKRINSHILLRRLDELFNILALSRLYLNLLPQTDNLGLKLLLLRLVALTQHIKPLVTQASAGVVLVNLDEQPL